MLWPEFPERVRSVAENGGVKLVSEEPGILHFKVSSGTKAGVKYDCTVSFEDIEDQIKMFTRDKKLWKRDGTGIDLRLLSTKLMHEGDIHVHCTCPAFQYWGMHYIATKYKSVYGHGENKRPGVRNPRERGLLCKHLELAIEVLPMYNATMARHIKTYYEDVVRDIEKGVLSTQNKPEKGGGK
jgi:hypothetical protein